MMVDAVDSLSARFAVVSYSGPLWTSTLKTFGSTMGRESTAENRNGFTVHSQQLLS